MDASSPSSPPAEPRWGIVVQARMGSTRAPGKMLRTVHDGRGLLDWVLDRLLQEFPPERVLLATTTNAADAPLAELAKQRGVQVFRGSEHDVLARFRDAARMAGWDHVVRVCADNPLLQVRSIPTLVEAATAAQADYASPFFSDGLPSIRSHCGLFAGWAWLEALDRVAALATTPSTTNTSPTTFTPGLQAFAPSRSRCPTKRMSAIGA